MRQRVKALFISDVHLGSKFTRVDELIETLKAYEPEYLFLVGDIIDGWVLQRKFRWNDSNSMLVRKLLSFIKYDTKIVYITGNHDEFLRNFTPLELGHILICDEYVYNIGGKQYLITHGDIFDGLIRNYKCLYWLGDLAYQFLMRFNKCYNKLRKLAGRNYWSISKAIKHQVKEAVQFVANYQHFLRKYAIERGCNGVICGHIHQSSHSITEGVEYWNCGDWVESGTYIIHHLDDSLELIDIDTKDIDNDYCNS